MRSLGERITISGTPENSNHFGDLDINLKGQTGYIIKTNCRDVPDEYRVQLDKPVQASYDPTLMLHTVTVYENEMEQA